MSNEGGYFTVKPYDFYKLITNIFIYLLANNITFYSMLKIFSHIFS